MLTLRNHDIMIFGGNEWQAAFKSLLLEMNLVRGRRKWWNGYSKLSQKIAIETVKIVVKTQIYMHWNVINKKIKISRDFRVFVLSPIPKNENLEIPEIHQKLQNTEMRVCNFKNSLNAVQTTSVSKWSSHIVNHAAANWVLKASDPSEYIELSLFLFMSVLTLKQLK